MSEEIQRTPGVFTLGDEHCNMNAHELLISKTEPKSMPDL